MEEKLVGGGLAVLGIIALGFVLGLPLTLWVTWGNGPDPALVEVGPLVAAVGSAAATLMVGIATYALVDRTEAQADATSDLTELTEKEQERNEPDLSVQKFAFRQGGGSKDSLDLWLVNRGWKPSSIQAIILQPTQEGVDVDASLIEVEFPEGRSRGDWRVEAGERVRFSVEFPSEKYGLTVGEPLTILIQPVLGEPLLLEFDYPPDGEPAERQAPHIRS